MSLPFGDVVLDDSRPAVFASAGIGITPMAGMLSHLVAAGSQLPITLLHADVGEASFALRGQVFEDLRALPGSAAHVWYEHGDGGAVPAEIHPGEMDLNAAKLPDGAGYYLCGALPFMKAV